MSKSIDQRVVEMRFDNKQFESATKQTLGTLQKLKEALNFTGSGKELEKLNKTAKDVDLSNIASSVAALEKRFSTLGIVGMRVIQNITDSLTGTLMKGFNFVINGIVEGGKKRAMNIENARFQLQSIVKDATRVEEIMSVASDSVNGTSYSFDVAAKAASQFTASGITDMGQLAEALRGMAGVTATFNADYEQMSMIFTQVAGQGRLMGDQLLQLSTRGANAAATIADYFNGVLNGSINANDSITSTIKAVTNGLNVTEKDIREFVSDGKINFEIFAGAMSHAFGDSAKEANKTFNGALSNIRAALARIGEGFFAPLIAQESEIVRLFNSIRLKINEVKTSLVFSDEINNVDALSKQFSDTVLKMAGAVADFIDKVDLTEPLSTFYYWVEIVKNGAKGIYSVLKPVAQAFRDVFLSFSARDVTELSAKIHAFTLNLKLSETGSKNLRDAFAGVFNVGKTVIDIFVKLAKVISPILKPVGALGEGMLELAGAFGRTLTAFSEWIRSSTLMEKAYSGLYLAVKLFADGVSEVFGWISKLIDYISELQIVERTMSLIVAIFQKFGQIVTPILGGIILLVKEFATRIGKMIPTNLDPMFRNVSNSIKKLDDNIRSINLAKPTEMFNKVKDALSGMLKVVSENPGVNTFIENLKKFFGTLQETLSIDNALSKIETFKTVMGGFTRWIKDTIVPLFDDLTLGGVGATALSGGLIYSVIKMAKAIEGATNSIKAIPDTFGAIRGVLKAYQEEIKADALMKTAKAIVLLAAAVGVLSLLDSNSVMAAATAVGILAAVLLSGSTNLIEALKKTKEAADVWFVVGKKLGQAANNFAKALKWKAIGGTIKSFGVTIALIAGSLIALALMYKNDSTSITQAIETLKQVAEAIAVTMVVMSVIGQVLSKGMKAFNTAAKGIQSIATSLLIVVASLGLLFMMDLPNDWLLKIRILTLLFSELALVCIALAAAGKISGDAKTASTPILAAATALILIVKAFEKLMAIDIGSPGEWIAKLGIFTLIMVEFAGLLIALGAAAKLAGGQMKAAGTLLAMAVFIGAITAALMVLSIIPIEKLVGQAILLGILLLAVAKALTGAAKMSDAGAAKTVLAMALMVGAITLALSVLSIIPWQMLTKAVIALGVMLGVLAADLYAASKIADQAAAKAVYAMVVQVAAITIALMALATKPWSQLLAAGGALSATLLAFAAAFKIISTIHVDLNIIATLAAGIVALIGVAAVLCVLSNQPYDGMLAAAFALTEVLLALTACLAVLSIVHANVPTALNAVAALDIFIANLAAVLLALGGLSKIPGVTELIAGGSGILSQLGSAIGKFVGSIISGVAEGLTSSLPQIGKNLSDFAMNLQPFIFGIKMVDSRTLESTGYIVAITAALTAAGFLDGIAKLLNFGKSPLESLGESLNAFAPHLVTFSQTVKNVDAGAVEAAANAGMMLTAFANTIPDTGGIKAVIMGDNDIAVFGLKLVIFGGFLKQFGEIVRGVDQAAVKGAAASGMMLAELANAIPKTGGLKSLFSGDNSLDDFGRKLVTFGESIKKYSESVADVNLIQLAGVATAFKTLIDLSAMIASIDTTPMSKFAKALEDMANNALQKFSDAFQNAGEKVQKVIKDEVDRWIKVITDMKKDFGDAGEKVIKELADSIKKSIKYEFKNIDKEMADVGKNLVSGIDVGIEKNKSGILASMKGLGSSMINTLRGSLGIHSPSTETILAVYEMARGVTVGKDKYAPLANEAMADLANGMTTTLSNTLDSNLNRIYAVYGGIVPDLTKPIEDATKKAQLSQKETTRLQKANVAETKKNTAASKAAHKEAIEEEKDYWYDLLQVKKQGLEAEKYMEMSAADFRKEVLEGAKEALNNYMDQLDSTRDSIMNQMDLFAEVEEQEYKTKEELIMNLNDQIDAYEEYVTVLGQINERLEGTELGEYLKQLGVDSLEQLKEINSMTDSQLSDYAMLYDTKLSLANDAAVLQLTNLQKETEAKLAELFGGMSSAVDLYDFAAVFDGSIESITKYVQDIMIPLQNAQLEAEAASKAIAAAVAAGFADESAFATAEGDMKAKLQEIIDNVKASQEEPAGEAGKEIGGNVTEGIAEGITEDTSTVTEKATELMDLLETAFKDAGEIHSPSERFKREIGKNIDLGIGEGIVDGQDELNSTGEESMTSLIDVYKLQAEGFKEIGETIVNTLKEAIQNQGENLTSQGVESTASYLQGFTNSLENAVNTATNLAQTILTTLTNKRGEYQDEGGGSATSFLQGIKDMLEEARSTATTFANDILTVLFNKYGDFLDRGTNSATQYLLGIKNKYEDAKTHGEGIAKESTQGIESQNSGFVSAGENATMGFVEGMKSKIREAASAAAEVARAAYEAAMSELDINSPSRKMFMVGDYAGIGMVNGLMKNVASAAKAGEAIAESAHEGASDALRKVVTDADLDLINSDPVIKPVVDLTEVENSVKTIQDLFNDAVRINQIHADSISASVSSVKSAKSSEESSKDGTDKGGDTYYEFTQNNYSPKALSRIDIYRQTNNQFTMLKGATGKS